MLVSGLVALVTGVILREWITVGIGGAGSGDTLYAALGNTSSNLWGLYKTTDGGRSWDKVLYIDDQTGAVVAKGFARR